MLPWFEKSPSTRELTIPGDVSSASFFIVAALIAGEASIHLPSVGINPTRMGLLDALSDMGARIDIHPTFSSAGEPIADITIHRSELTSMNLSGENVVRCIDEIPIFAIAAATAQGMSRIRDAHELRVKECDRIEATCKGLANIGVSVVEHADGFDVTGQKGFHSGTISTFGDHRLAMSFAIAALNVDGSLRISDANVVAVSYPEFYRDLERICHPH
jgi:3-phosphoshikimate 1-carboxyvinyltransferase